MLLLVPKWAVCAFTRTYREIADWDSLLSRIERNEQAETGKVPHSTVLGKNRLDSKGHRSFKGYDSLMKRPYSAVLAASLAAMFLVHALPRETFSQSKITGATPNPGSHLSNGPDCSGSWPTDMAFVLMKNAGITNNEKIDFSKTKTVRLASQRIGEDLYHQVYDVVLTEYSGRTIEAIAVHDASHEECSMTGVDLFVVSQRLTSNIEIDPKIIHKSHSQ